jgi:hypothetical protein
VAGNSYKIWGEKGDPRGGLITTKMWKKMKLLERETMHVMSILFEAMPSYLKLD